MTENRSFLESMGEKQKPESFAEEKFEYLRGGSPKKLIILGAAALILLIVVFTVIALTGRVQMPDLAGVPLQDAYIWAQKSKVTLAVKNAYSLEVAENIILAQDVAAGGSIKKNFIITVIASLGPDPEELVEFPDLKAMTLPGIEAWVSENKLTGVRIETAYSDIVAENEVIAYSLTDGTEEVFKRKNRVTVTVSRGAAAVSETVVMEDFASYRAAAVLQWGRDNRVTINLTEAFDPYIAAGNVISQSVKKGTEIQRTDSISVVISKGKSVTTANFTTMSKEEASSWARLHNVTLTFIEKYTNSHAKGKIYSQSIASSTAVAEGQEIKISVSLGRVEVPSFIGKTRLDVLNWQQDVNAKGAGISLAFSEAYGDKGTAGTIISQSVRNDMVNTGTDLAVTLSNGMRLVTPDYSGMREEEVKTAGRDLGLKILFDYQYHGDVERGFVIGQTVARDTIISDAETITVLISLGPNP